MFARQWVQECEYISRVTERNGKVSEFNYDPSCFARYCRMMAGKAEKQGFYDSAEYIQQCADELEA